MRSWRCASETETERLGELLGGELRPDGVLLLHGDLGSGKTVLTRGVARALGIDAAEIQSPTFVLVREHEGARGRLIHVDLYRLEPAEAEAVGIEELLAGPGVKVVEWAERLAVAPPDALRAAIEREEPPARAGSASSRERRRRPRSAPVALRLRGRMHRLAEVATPLEIAPCKGGG